MSTQYRISPRRLLFYLAIEVTAFILPITLWKLDLPIISSTYGRTYQPFELLGFTMSCSLIICGYIESRLCRGQSFVTMLPAILFALVSFHSLVLITEFSAKSFDYDSYETAAKAVIQGTNPYDGRYLYPPFTAQLLAATHWCIKTVMSFIETNTPDTVLWYLVFYSYQCGQFLLIQLMLILSYTLARVLGIERTQAAILVGVLIIFNNSLVRTIVHNQTNLIIVVLILTSLLLLRRYPILSGITAAFGGHIKLYPLILLLPWALTLKVTAIIGAVIGFAAIVLMQTHFGQDWQLWGQFFEFAKSADRTVSFMTTPLYRDNSLHSILGSSFRLFDRASGMTASSDALITTAVTIASIAVVGWFGLRYLRREKAYAIWKTVQHNDGQTTGDHFRLYGHSIDALALILIISPIVWEHQYLLALPIVIWAYAVRGTERLWSIGLAAILMFALPTFDVFPLSYHRLAGLFFLIIQLPSSHIPLKLKEGKHPTVVQPTKRR